MRKAASYSIVDHELLHGKYLHRLSHEAMSLYLFLCVVSDRDGKSFYGERAIQNILRFSNPFQKNLQELLTLKLIDYRRPYFWINNLETSSYDRSKRKDPLPERRVGPLVSSNCQTNRHQPPQRLEAILRNILGETTTREDPVSLP